MSKKKVGIFVRELFHYRLGVFNNLIANSKYNISIYTNDKKRDFNSKKIYEKTFKFFGKKIRYQKKLRTLIREENLDIVILPFSPYIVSTFLLPLIDRNRDYKLIAWTHGYFKGSEFNSWKNKILRYFIKMCDGVLLFDEDTAEKYIASGFDKEKVFFTDNTLDTDKIINAKKRVSKKEIDEIFSNYNLENKNVLIFVGRLIQSKRTNILLKSLNYLNNNYGQDYFLFVIGDGPKKNKLLDYVNKNKINNVEFLGSVFQEDKLAPYFISSDLFVMPGKTGLSINHAFSYGLPYITTSDNIHSPEIILLEEGINGEYFNSDDYIDLANTINNIFESPVKVKKYKENALSQIKKRYNIKNMEQRFLDLFDSY